MHFKINADEYRLGFRYVMTPRVKNYAIRTRDITITINEEWNRHTAQAVLFRKVDGPGLNDRDRDTPREFHWEEVVMGSSQCSKLDHFSKIRGREIALGRLLKRDDLSGDMKLGIRESYMNRFPAMPVIEERELTPLEPTDVQPGD